MSILMHVENFHYWLSPRARVRLRVFHKEISKSAKQTKIYWMYFLSFDKGSHTKCLKRERCKSCQETFFWNENSSGNIRDFWEWFNWPIGNSAVFFHYCSNLKMLTRAYLHNKKFILAYSNQNPPLFSTFTNPKEQQQ